MSEHLKERERVREKEKVQIEHKSITFITQHTYVLTYISAINVPFFSPHAI